MVCARRIFLPFILLLVLNPFVSAHPGPGIVKDSKGNIYYTDLVHVWKLSPNGHKTKAVSGVHTHQLYIDQDDILLGEHLWYNGEQSNSWSCYAWRLHPNGKLDTVFGPGAAFQNEYSLTRDQRGNQYYVQQQPVKKFYRINPDGSLKKLAEGDFNSIGFMLVTKEGKWYFTSENNLYVLDTSGQISMLVKDIGSVNLSHPGNIKEPYVLGIWEDQNQNIYVADHSGQKVKRISPQGKVDVIAYSKSPWSPVGGLMDDQDNLWILENDVSNKVQVRKVTSTLINNTNTIKSPVRNYGLVIAILIAILVAFYYSITRNTNIGFQK